MPRFKSINFYQNMPKIKLFLQKIQTLDPRFPVDLGCSSPTSSLRRMGALPPDLETAPPPPPPPPPPL